MIQRLLISLRSLQAPGQKTALITHKEQVKRQTP